MTADVTLARDILRRNVDFNLRQSARLPIHAALASLQQLVGPQSEKWNSTEPTHSHEQPTCHGPLRGRPLPPLDIVVNLLRELKDKPLMTFTLICVLESAEYFTTKCREVFFATEEFTPAAYVIVNAGLLHILQEKAVLSFQATDNVTAAHYQALSNTCRDNLEAALVNLTVFMTMAKENIQALLMGVNYAIESAQLTLAWQLSSLACQLCLKSGYHRQSIDLNETEDVNKKRAVLFWVAYALDKNLSLRLGRSAVLQDSKITLSRTLEPFEQFDNQRQTLQNWLIHAQVQGRVYEDLYSPTALSGSAEKRLRTAFDCISTLQVKLVELSQELQQSAEEPGDEVNGILLLGDKVATLSTLTLVYRAIPPVRDFAILSVRTFCHIVLSCHRKAGHVRPFLARTISKVFRTLERNLQSTPSAAPSQSNTLQRRRTVYQLDPSAQKPIIPNAGLKSYGKYKRWSGAWYLPSTF
ncbi:putative Transcription factor domain-containing protein [Seiridium cardinale]|uniref:Transcription factor domain-containing protein n=1 Tax=Seiridium cardinale TaxID=138064 RepID=A0ABR2Y3L1_9PEZI